MYNQPTAGVVCQAAKSSLLRHRRQLLPSAPAAAPAAASGQVGRSDALPPTLQLHHRIMKQQTSIAVVHQNYHPRAK